MYTCIYSHIIYVQCVHLVSLSEQIYSVLHFLSYIYLEVRDYLLCSLPLPPSLPSVSCTLLSFSLSLLSSFFRSPSSLLSFLLFLNLSPPSYTYVPDRSHPRSIRNVKRKKKLLSRHRSSSIISNTRTISFPLRLTLLPCLPSPPSPLQLLLPAPTPSWTSPLRPRSARPWPRSSCTWTTSRPCTSPSSTWFASRAPRRRPSSSCSP